MRTLAELVPLRSPACREAEAAIVMVAAGEADVDPQAAQHVTSCLRCQAEVAAYRRVMAVMRSMRADLLPFNEGALGATLRAVHDGSQGVGWGTRGVRATRGARAARAAYVGGITAASAAGLLVWISRRRPGLPQAS